MKTEKEEKATLLEALYSQGRMTTLFKKKFFTERNIKNGLYYFILKKGLFEELKNHEPFANYQTTDSHKECLKWLLNSLEEKE